MCLFYANRRWRKRQILCRRTILRRFQIPVIYEGTNGDIWIYSLPSTTRVTYQCSDPNNGIHNVNSESISKYFTLRPHLQGQFSATVRRNHIIVPPIDNLLSSSEMTMFNFTLNDQLIQLDHINRILNETGSADTADIDLLQRKLTEIKIRPHSYTVVLLLLNQINCLFLLSLLSQR